MKKALIASSLVFVFTLGFAVAPAWAFECPSLYAECQELLKTKKNEKAEKLCEEGIKLHKAGDHDGAVEKLEAGLELLEQ